MFWKIHKGFEHIPNHREGREQFETDEEVKEWLKDYEEVLQEAEEEIMHLDEISNKHFQTA